MQLVERGQDRSRRRRQHLHRLQDPGLSRRSRITMRQIMTHTSGFEEVIRDLIVSDPALARPDAGRLSARQHPGAHLSRRARCRPIRTTPRRWPATSSSASPAKPSPTTSSTTSSIRSACSTPRFVQPLPEAHAARCRTATRTSRDGEAQLFEIIPAAPAGALSLTGADMARFMNAHLNDGAGLMRPETARHDARHHRSAIPGREQHGARLLPGGPQRPAHHRPWRRHAMVPLQPVAAAWTRTSASTSR